MQTSAELGQAMFDSAAQGIAVVDATGTIVRANPELARMFGYEREDLAGRGIESLVPISLRDAHSRHRAAYFEHPKARPMGSTLTLDAVRRDGEMFPIEVSLGHCRVAGIPYAIAFVADISERRRLERVHERDAERLRTLTAQLLTAQQDERRSIARELHDGVTQDLASVGIELGLIRRNAPPEVAAQLTKAQENVGHLADQVRRMAHEFHPGVLEHLGLAAAIEAHCRETARQTSLDICFTQRGLGSDISAAIAATLFRICQEALRNVCRHAGAEHVDVTLALEESAPGVKLLRLSVADDGKGFAVEESREGAGLGLLSIEERARLVQGNLVINSIPGEGTRVTVQVPIAGV